MFTFAGGLASNSGVVFGASDSDGSNAIASSYTFLGLSIGTAYADRDVLLFVRSYGVTSGDHDVGTVTIGGVTATLIGQSTQYSRHMFSVHVARVPAGTVADVVVTFDENAASCSIFTLPVRGVSNFTYSASYYDDLLTPYVITISPQPSTEPKWLYFCQHYDTGGATTVTGLTEISNNTTSVGSVLVTGVQEPAIIPPYFTLADAMTDIIRGILTCY